MTKKQVDNFREGKLTPCCQLLAEFEITKEEEYIPTLKLRVNLKGAKYPNDIFVINIPARCIIEPQERSQTSEDLGMITHTCMQLACINCNSSTKLLQSLQYMASLVVHVGHLVVKELPYKQ